MLFFFCFLMLMLMMFIVFLLNIWVYVFFWFVNGFGWVMIGMCVFVFLMEFVGKSWWGCVGIMSFFGFMFGFLFFFVMVYMNSGNLWSMFYIWIFVLIMIYCVLVWYFVCEFLSWLFVSGCSEEVILIFKSVVLIFMSDGIMSFLSLLIEEEEDEKFSVNIYVVMKVLVEKSWVFSSLIVVMVVVFGIGLVYYGMFLVLLNFDFNVYMSVVFNVLMDLLVNFIMFFFVDKFSSKNVFIGFMVLGGIFSVFMFVL